MPDPLVLESGLGRLIRQIRCLFQMACNTCVFHHNSRPRVCSVLVHVMCWPFPYLLCWLTSVDNSNHAQPIQTCQMPIAWSSHWVANSYRHVMVKCLLFGCWIALHCVVKCTNDLVSWLHTMWKSWAWRCINSGVPVCCVQSWPLLSGSVCPALVTLPQKTCSTK